MFLARQTHIRLGQGQGQVSSGGTTEESLARPEDLNLGQTGGLGAEFLDTDEPAELFPPLCFDKLLRFRQMPARPVVQVGGYLFSQMIEDMDRLWRLQLPREQQEEIIQQISEQLSPTASKGSEGGGCVFEC